MKLVIILSLALTFWGWMWSLVHVGHRTPPRPPISYCKAC
jgi:hypothetical protein